MGRTKEACVILKQQIHSDRKRLLKVSQHQKTFNLNNKLDTTSKTHQTVLLLFLTDVVQHNIREVEDDQNTNLSNQSKSRKVEYWITAVNVCFSSIAHSSANTFFWHHRSSTLRGSLSPSCPVLKLLTDRSDDEKSHYQASRREAAEALARLFNEQPFVFVYETRRIHPIPKLWVIVIVCWESERVTTTGCLWADAREMKTNVDRVAARHVSDDGRRFIIYRRRGSASFLFILLSVSLMGKRLTVTLPM